MYYHWASGFNLTPNRWYDSRTGRWLSRDPIAENGGTNLYNYVGGNVLNYTDPSGLFAIPVGQCLVGAGVMAGGPLGWILGGLIIADAVVGSILNSGSDSGSGGDKARPPEEVKYPNNPSNPEARDDYRRGPAPGTLKGPDGSIWEKDHSKHGGSEWKRWPNEKDWERDRNRESVRPDGSVR